MSNDNILEAKNEACMLSLLNNICCLGNDREKSGYEGSLIIP